MVTLPRGWSSARSRGLPASAILGLGLLATAVSMVLLFVPFFDAPSSAVFMVRDQILLRLHGRGPGILHLWLHYGVVPTLVLLWLLVLAWLPWRAALRRQDAPSSEVPATAEPSRPAEPEESGPSLLFTDGGTIEDSAHPGSWRIFRSTPELKAMARDARIPWRAEYETAGGARAFLEILRIVSAEGAGGIPQDTVAPPEGAERELGPTEEASQPQESRPPAPSGPAVSAETQYAVLHTDLGDRADHAERVDHADFADLGDHTDLGARAAGAPDEDPADLRASHSSWTPSFSGSVYTSTDLYTSDRLEGTADQEDEPGTGSGEPTGGATP